MLYLLAIILPPVAVLMCGKPLQAVLNLVLTLLFYFPGLIHALFVVNSHLADQRNEKAIKASEKQNKELIKATEKSNKELAEALKKADKDKDGQ
jgi:uncharacterized membrane protein YqaE (UPF0057 family)